MRFWLRGYCTRIDDVEIDIVGADRHMVAKEIRFVGSVKWLENSSFGRHDLAALYAHRAPLTSEPVPEGEPERRAPAQAQRSSP